MRTIKTRSMFTQDKIDAMVVAGKARAVELSGKLTEIGNDGSYRFRKEKYRLMYLMSYIQLLENYNVTSGLLRDEEIIRAIEMLDLMCMKPE